MNQSHPHRFRATVEPLEDRCLPAGGVRAVFSSATGVLQIKGTELADQIVVEQKKGGNGRIRVLGVPINVDGDRQKGVQGRLVENVVVHAGGGDDFIDLRLLRRETKVDAGAGNDVLWGTPRDDVMDGGPGMDSVYGGAGADHLRGGADADVLFGGASPDELLGDAGADRLLVQAEDTITQSDGDDAILRFDDGTTGAWTDAEIMQMDEAFARLQSRTNNTRLLKRVNGGDLRFTREAVSTSTGDVLADNNSQGRLRFYDGAFNGTQPLWEIVFHEIGHNFDTENPFWNDFQGLSGWTQTDPADPVNFRKGLDTRESWWHRTTATFATTYSRTNAREDFAEAFAATLGGQGASRIPSKVSFINAWLNGLVS